MLRFVITISMLFKRSKETKTNTHYFTAFACLLIFLFIVGLYCVLVVRRGQDYLKRSRKPKRLAETVGHTNHMSFNKWWAESNNK